MSATVPGFIVVVIWLDETTLTAPEPLVQTPAPLPTPHLNCTTFPDAKPLP